MRAILSLVLTALVLAAPASAGAETRVPASADEIALSFAPLVRKAAPAVVNVYATRIVANRRTPLAADPFFGGFFREFAPMGPRIENSLGSGVILSPDGYMVSNYHVVGMASEIRAVTKDRREFVARLVLADEEADLAIMKLEGARDMPWLPLRDSDTVEVGELVLAIGNPFGIGQTVSSGIVSGLARSGTATGNARGYYIQTDAAINPGNSGGALIDIKGRLIGINTSILTRSGGSNGIGFAIPSRLVQVFLEQARAGRTRFQRPWAGLTGQPVAPDMSEAFGLGIPEGIVITDLHEASPFAAAGFRVGDVILAVDGKPVNTPQEMMFRMAVAGIGRTATVTRLRRGETAEIAVRMIAAPDDPPRDETVIGHGSRFAGMRLARANPAVIAEMGLPLHVRGVVVLEPGRLGARLGLRRGDVIDAVDGRRVTGPREAARRLDAAGRLLDLRILRDGRRLLMRIRV